MEQLLRRERVCRSGAWKVVEYLSGLVGKSLKFRFHLRNGRLYAFWISRDRVGASHGYVAAGGPGFTGPADTMESVAKDE
jgi:hypothetical protein